MPWIEKEGRSVDEAQAAAIGALGIPEEDAEIEVLREGAKGLFGLGGEAALVRARPRAEALDVRAAFHDRPPVESAVAEAANAAGPPVAVAERFEPAPSKDEERDGEPQQVVAPLSDRQRMASELAVEMVKGILDRMGLGGEVTTRVAGGTVFVEVFGDEMGILIGRGGKTLEALQELVRAAVQRKLKARVAVVVDVEAYWERRRETTRGGRRPGGPRSPR